VAEVKRGIIPGNGGTQRILEQLPYAIAMEMLLTGDPIDAANAARFGLINEVVPKDQLMPAALAMAQRIASNAPLAVQAAKELAVRSRDTDPVLTKRGPVFGWKLLPFVRGIIMEHPQACQ
jgi:enoyl-CoA hydratase/carnithine racemase